jgi:prevent-host-death family protein
MLIASISEAKNKLSALIDRVKAGESVLIVDRGKPVARLEPALIPGEDSESRLARLERAGLIKRGTGRLPDDFFTRKLPRPRGGVSIVDILLEERREGR